MSVTALLLPAREKDGDHALSASACTSTLAQQQQGRIAHDRRRHPQTSAAFAAALHAGATVIVDPRPYADPGIAAVFSDYPHIGPVLPAMGYSPEQVASLRATINAAEADVVVAGTPIDLGGLLGTSKPVVRARYEFAELDTPGLRARLDAFFDGMQRAEK